MIKLLLIDNYDSFSYNLQYAFSSLGVKVMVCRNDIDRAKLDSLIDAHDGVVISPGPGNPQQAGHCLDIIADYHETKPVLGICLGHQAIVEAFGGEIVRADNIVHGKTALLDIESRGLFADMTAPIRVARYHSLQANPRNMPSSLRVDATVRGSNVVMAVSHTQLPVYGVQFHPESIMTRDGDTLLKYFLKKITH